MNNKTTLRLAFLACSERINYGNYYFSFTIRSINTTNPIQRTCPWPLYRQVKSPWYPLKKRLGGPQSGCEQFGRTGKFPDYATNKIEWRRSSLN